MNTDSMLGFSEEVVRQGLMFVPFKQFKKSEKIYNQGDLSSQLFIVKNGAVKIFKSNESGDEYIQDVVTEGEIFGDWGTLIHSDVILNHSAVALTEKTCIHILKTKDLNPQVKSMAISVMVPIIMKQKEKLEKRHERLLKSDAAFRIRDTLIDLASRGGHRFGEETLLKIGISHEEIAQLADTSRQTVTTVMNDLKNNGKIYYTRDRILFRNLDQIHN
ncbi:Crp/Fnr family transcriptional regulator [Pararhodonellum marinum]|uniref:Crp/Fnr family transcriptional regulator n=1 Tax=Pararhodonellum marinum TaxID=2755358 RepID=UPI00188EC246|nr:Crp/Fnr family transcriptional regulator [Pararhodonellum marinum]